LITGTLIGKEHLVPFLRTITPRVETELRKEIESLAISLLRKVKQDKLSGQVLKNRTGTLRASINYRMEAKPRSIYGIVGTNKEYAAAHEFGFNGQVTVREHLRMITKAFGQSIKDPHQIMVKSHNRHAVVPMRSFLRSSLQEMDTEIRDRIAAALKRSVNG